MRFPTLRLFWRIVKGSGAHKALTVYGIFFVLIALLIWLVDPAVPTFRASLWYCFVSLATIGFGDITASTLIPRIVTVLLWLYAVVVLAILTAVITGYFLDAAKLKANESVQEFLSELERLPELSREELAELSERVKKFNKK